MTASARTATAPGSDADATAAIEAHRVDTTDVHGITDTVLLVRSDDARLSDPRPPTAHTHDDRYYTEAEVDALVTARVAALLGPRPWVPGRFYTPWTAATSSAIPFEATLELLPFYVPAGARFDQIGADVTVVGTAGAVVRLGIYADDGFGRPGDRLLDAGTVPGTAVTQAMLDLAPFTFPAPGLYWTGAAVQGAAGTRPTVRRGTSHGVPVSGATAAQTAGTPGGYQLAGVPGALPASAAGAVLNGGGAMRPIVRAVA